MRQEKLDKRTNATELYRLNKVMLDRVFVYLHFERFV